MLKIVSVVGARPNFMKIAPFVRAIEEHNQSAGDAGTTIEHQLVHTGQHYDERMSKAFFGDLNIPPPDVDLEIGSGTHAEQVGRTMIAFEKTLEELRPDWVVVVGDVNATCACSITAKKLNIKVAHIEAGLRSFDLEMPEEINRIVTDRLSDLLFTTDEIANANLKKEGVADPRIQFVGNIMIDTLEYQRERASQLNITDIVRGNLLLPERSISELEGAADGEIAVMTMHRPSNVDEKEALEPILRFIVDRVARDLPVIWPIHPRTMQRLRSYGLREWIEGLDRVFLVHPVGYREMLRLNMAARIMLTDSGGLQEECCVLGTSCMTLRWNTERPVTLAEHGGASVLVGNDVQKLEREYERAMGETGKASRPPKWDGETAPRIVAALVEAHQNHSPVPRGGW